MDFSVMQKALRRCNMFQGLDEGQLGLLAMNAEEKEFGAEETVYRQGDDATVLLL